MRVAILLCDVITAHRALGLKKTVARSQPNWLTEMKELLLRYQDLRYHNPEDHNMSRHCRENLTSIFLLYRPNVVVQKNLHSKACVQPSCKVL
jgi:hypothetical protein